MSPRIRLIAAALLLMSYLLPWTAHSRPDDGSAAFRVINQAEILYRGSTAGGLPDTDDAGWQAVTLPFTRTDSAFTPPPGAGPSLRAWFRLTLTAPDDRGRYSLLFWRYNRSLEVYLNRDLLEADPQRPGRHSSNWNRPMLVDIQPASWQPGANEVLISLGIDEWGGTLAPPLFGATPPLRERYETRLFRQIEINRLLLVFGLALGLLSLVIWLARRQDAVYLWFAATTLTWTVLVAHMIIRHNPLPWSIWLPIVHTALDACALFLAGFISRVVGLRNPGQERIFIVWVLIAGGIHTLSPPQYFWMTAYSAHMVSVLALIVVAIRIGGIALRQRHLSAIVITSALLLQALLFTHNAWMMFFDGGERWDQSITYAHAGIPLLLLCFAALLFKRFIDAMNEAETLNRELESRVQASRQLIEKSHAEQHALELAHTAEKERLSIYRDLHDDVGSRLLSIVHAGQGSHLSDMARAALESLRQAVSRANTTNQPLAQLFRDIREEATLRLLGSGHAFSWDQSAIMPDHIVASAAAYNINRIFREAVSNIIRHARADRVRIAVDREGNGWLIRIIDNGCGLTDDQVRGNGMKHMESRAAETGARLHWEPAPEGGTQVSLYLPANSIQHASRQVLGQ